MKEKIEKIFADCDIPQVGFCDFEAISAHLLSCRAMLRLPQNAKTAIMCVFPYKVNDAPPENISRYAAVPDYHAVCGKKLEKVAEKLSLEFAGFKFEPFIDNSPIPEVSTAAFAGLGVKGKNGLLITKKWGSFVFIGEIVTDLEIACTDKSAECENCGRCIDACPKREICLSNLSQKKGELSAEQSEILRRNNIVWGCDICAEICPKNKNAQKTEIPEFIEGYRDRYTPGEDIQGRAYAWRGEKTVRRNAENLEKSKKSG